MGSKTTSQVTNTPNPTASAAYNNVINQAQSVASTPYTPYTGELTAGLNGGQQQAIGQLEGAYGTARPFFQGGTQQLANASGGLGNVANYLQAGSESTAGVQPYQAAASNQYGQANTLLGQSTNALSGIQPYLDSASGSYGQAAGYGQAAANSYGAMSGMIGSADTAYGQAGQAYGQASSGLGQVGQYLSNANGYFGQAAGLATPQDFNGADGVSKYENPYTQDVINTTMATARQNDAAQTASVVGNAIGSGAYGGDRNGIAVAALSGQQDMANNSTIAGLNQANYSQATAQFNATQAQRQAGAGIFSNLGQGELQAGNTQLNDALGYAQVGAGMNANAAGYAGLGSLYGQQGQGYASLGSLANATGSGYAGLGQIQGQTAQQYGSLAGTSTGVGAGFNSTGQLGLGTAAEYGTLGQLQGTTGQAYGTLGGLYGNLGTQAQSAATSGASAGLQGATLQQQTQQAQDTANYGQFQNQIQYPFNETGFLSNIVQGIGSASGGTSTTQGSGLSQIAGAATSGLGVLGVTGAFGANGYLTGAGGALSSLSDEHAKENIEPVGETYDGQTIHRYNYKGSDPRDVKTGLLAQEVEGHRPDAVSTPAGFGGLKAVNYAKALDGAADRGHFARGGGLGNVARMMGAPGQIRVGSGLGGVRPHFDAGGGLGNVRHHFDDGGTIGMSDGSLQSNAFAQDLAHNPLSQTRVSGGSGSTLPGGNLSRMPTASAAAPSSGAGGLGALTAAPSSGGGLSNLSGSGGGQGSGSSDTFGAGNDKLWMSLIAGGAGAMSGGSASGLANIGKGISDGLSEYQGLKNADRQNALAQSEITSRAAETALATRRQDFTEAQANRLINASNNVAKILQNSTDPTNAQTAGAPAPSPSTPAPQPAAAPAAPSGLNSTIPGSAAPVPALAASSAPAGPTPSTVAQTASPQAAGAGDFWARVSPENNPALLAQQAAQFNKMGQAYLGQGFSEQANQMFTQANSLVNRGRQITDAGYVNMRDGTVQTIPGFTAAKAGQAATTSAATAAAQAGVDNQNALVAVQPTPGGPVQYVTKAQALQMANGAGGQPGQPGGLVKDQPPAFGQKQDAIAKNEIAMSDQFQARQVARERLDTMSNIMTKYQTGDLAGAKADAIAFGNAIGLKISPSETADPNFFQQFTKNATANVFDGVRSMGGQPRVAEIEGLTKANANPEMQPAANAAILAQAKGILNQEDQHYQDYTAWKAKNPYATDTAGFEIPWQKANPIGRYVGEAAKDIPYKGQVVPTDPAQRVVGQSYMSPTGKIAKWTPQGWAAVQGN